MVDGKKEPLDAIVVLGCRAVVQSDRSGTSGSDSSRALALAPGALARRVEAAVEAYARRGRARTVVLVSGGRRWGRIVEADAMAVELALRGVPDKVIVRERCSMSTAENAHYSAEILRRRGSNLAAVAVVTCEWHARGANRSLRRAEVPAEAVVATDHAPFQKRIWRWGRERILSALSLVLSSLVLVAVLACA